LTVHHIHTWLKYAACLSEFENILLSNVTMDDRPVYHCQQAKPFDHWHPLPVDFSVRREYYSFAIGFAMVNSPKRAPIKQLYSIYPSSSKKERDNILIKRYGKLN
jgi:hypothetical protein